MIRTKEERILDILVNGTVSNSVRLRNASFLIRIDYSLIDPRDKGKFRLFP